MSTTDHDDAVSFIWNLYRIQVPERLEHLALRVYDGYDIDLGGEGGDRMVSVLSEDAEEALEDLMEAVG